MRAGVITASKFKTVCHTDVATPSKSIVMNICYPGNKKFSNDATSYGIKHEKNARDQLHQYLITKHQNCTIEDCGFFRSIDHPYLGASPDGLINCSCCEFGYVIEVKCPYKCTTHNITELAESDPNFCMELNKDDNKYHLKKHHAYYYQVQLQMLVTERPRCYLIVFYPTVCLIEELYIDIVLLEKCIPLARHFYLVAILPELTSKWFSREYIDLPEFFIASNSNESNEKTCCICNKNETENIVRCSDKTCVVKIYISLRVHRTGKSTQD